MEIDEVECSSPWLRDGSAPFQIKRTKISADDDDFVPSRFHTKAVDVPKRGHRRSRTFDAIDLAGIAPALEGQSSARLTPLRKVNPYSPEVRTDARSRRVAVKVVGSSQYRQDFEELEHLGKGAFGEVYVCRQLLDGCRYAVKRLGAAARRIHGHGEPATQKMLQEVYALAAYSDHPHIVSYQSAWLEEDDLYIQLELCERGSLGQRFAAGEKLEEPQLLVVSGHIAGALAHLHSRGAAHKDVKPDNIFEALEGIYKLGDLGLTTAIPLEGEIGPPVLGQEQDLEGDSRYLSREVLQSLRTCDFKAADVFALGASLYELARGAGRLPPDGEEWVLIRDGHLYEIPGFSTQFQTMLKTLMRPDWSQRPSASLIMCDEFLCSAANVQILQVENQQLGKQVQERQAYEALQVEKLEASRLELKQLEEEMRLLGFSQKELAKIKQQSDLHEMQDRNSRAEMRHGQNSLI